jgi:hypothetical protein
MKYALQYGKGRIWRTAKAYDAEKTPYAFVSEIMLRMVIQGGGKHWRILIQPFNVLAETSASA